MIDLIAYILVRILNRVFSIVPISVSLWIGRRLGALAFVFNKKRRLIAYANLKSAFSGEKSPKELRRITKRVYQNMVQTFVEILNLTKINKKFVDKYVEVVNMERIENAAKSGRGTILLTAHFGDWELSSLVSSVKGFPIMVLVREQKMKRLNELLNRLRESNGCKVIRKGMSVKNLMKALYGKNIVGILSDQDAGRNGMFVDFFGRPTSCHSGAMEMAKHTGSLILPNFIVRVNGPYHKLFLEEYIDFKSSENSGDVKDNLQKFTSLLESYIRRYPDQWLWLHKRWKSTPTRTILVLNDGKAGHLNQSLAVARYIQKARTTQGYRMDDTRVIIVDVKYRNAASRLALSLCASFATWRCHGCMRCMKAFLDEKTYNTLMGSYAEFVVSCGSSLAGVNIFMAKENNAKNIVVMKPNIAFGLKKFKLAIIPKHDRPARSKNVVETILAPNLIDRDALRIEGNKIKGIIKDYRPNSVSIFIGGDNSEFCMTGESINEVLGSVLSFCEKYDYDILLTTSRRTPVSIESVIKGRLKNNPRCKLLVIANENNIDGAVAGMLGLSTIAVVSGESVSMVSEAVSSGKRVAVFTLDKKVTYKTKHETSLKIIEDAGYILTSAPDRLKEALNTLHGMNQPDRIMPDEAGILEAVRRLI